MKKNLIALVILLCNFLLSEAATIKGIITDLQTGEALVGVSLHIKETPQLSAATGLDGSFTLSGITSENVTLICNYVGYTSIVSNLKMTKNGLCNVEYHLQSTDYSLKEVKVVGGNKETDISARSLERNATGVINVISAKTIELSPDITVANVIQRVSGITVERNSTGDGQYAILRGMDKRYNYTLVNGIKIPSPDNKNRFVPLDIFPAELLERLEVTKSLTADMEGDAVGGTINLVMKDAPNSSLLKVNMATGYNTLFLDHNFQTYNVAKILQKSPFELYGQGYPAKAKDFPSATVQLEEKRALPNLMGGFSIGNRFFNDLFGIILAGSYQNFNKGSNSTYFGSSDASNLPELTSYSNRFYSEQQTRLGLHCKMDLRLSKYHKLKWYTAYMNLSNIRIRDQKSIDLDVGYNPSVGDYNTSYSTRFRYNEQSIVNSTLHGEHGLLNEKLKIDWNAVYSKAGSNSPDNAIVNTKGSVRGGVEKLISVATMDGEDRRWEHNDDVDFAGYLRSLAKINKATEVSMGGMFRNKQRSSFFNEYTLIPYNAATGGNNLIKGVDWNDYSEITFNVKNPMGSTGDALNYDATESVVAGFAQIQLKNEKWQLTSGMRLEHTNQGYTLLHPVEGVSRNGSQDYNDWLPSAHIKYSLLANQFIKASYFRSINRPSFFEIVPYNVVNEDFTEKGNPGLKHTCVDNLDLRYEYFPHATEQLMVGLFYKKLKDPIEYGMITQGQSSFFSPQNYGTAVNSGIEIDVIKYFRSFGFKANYTYTHSTITTTKMHSYTDPVLGIGMTENINQTRMLYGQSPNVCNLVLLYKNVRYGWDAQVAGAFTDKRLYSISRYLNNDIWQKGSILLDASLEKSWKFGLAAFAKVGNILNSPMILYLNQLNPANNDIPQLELSNGTTLVRKDYYGVQLQIGFRFKL
ncbi:MAG: TonB-dependent receptor domain-containing protein [Bacteroidales bacterium]